MQLDPSRGRRAGVELALRDAIRAGRLSVGDELPSTRALALDLGVSRATVVAAYEQLTAEGHLTAEQGRATRVAHGGTVEPSLPDANPLGPPLAHDFRPGRPDLSAFPRRAWQRSLRRVLTEAPDDAFGYADPRGRVELRMALAGYLGRARSVDANPSAVSIVGGFVAALGFLGEYFARAGQGRIAVEDPMLFFHREVLRLVGVECVPVPVDDEGLCVDRLGDLGGEVDAVLVCPAHQYPIGGTLAPERRAMLVDWARRSDSWIIEDDYDAEFRYDRRPVGALQGLAPDRVIHAGTASKTLGPGLRMAWLTVPPTLRAKLAWSIHTRAGVPSIDQLAFADFLERGELDRHIRGLRPRYRARRDAVRDRLAEFEWLAVPEHAAGLHVCARFTGPAARPLDEGGLDDRDVERRLMERSVGTLSLSRHHAGSAEDAPQRGLVLGFANPPEHHFPAALDALVAALRDVPKPDWS